jgi:hypothetical protein
VDTGRHVEIASARPRGETRPFQVHRLHAFRWIPSVGAGAHPHHPFEPPSGEAAPPCRPFA